MLVAINHGSHEAHGPSAFVPFAQFAVPYGGLA